MRRTIVAIPDEAKDEAVAYIRAALPKGFSVARIPEAEKPNEVAVEITGPKTDGHATGSVRWAWNLSRAPITPEIVDGFKRSCKAWAKEPLLGEKEPQPQSETGGD